MNGEFTTFQSRIVEDRQPNRVVTILGGGAVALAFVAVVAWGASGAVKKQDEIDLSRCTENPYNFACQKASATANRSSDRTPIFRYQ